MTEQRLHSHRSGSGSRTIVFLHGFGATHRAWATVQEELSRSFSTIAFDLPGHGGSLDFEGAGRAKLAADAVTADIRSRGLGSVHLVGHSMGGTIAALLALRAPELAASLTLLAPGGFGPEINQRLLTRYARAIRRDELQDALENMFGWNNPVPEGVLDDHVRMRAVPGQRERLLAIVDQIACDGVQGVIARDELRKLKVPVKVVWGTQDRVLPTRQAHHMPGMFGVHIFEDTGHMLQNERPAEVAALIAQNAR